MSIACIASFPLWKDCHSLSVIGPNPSRYQKIVGWVWAPITAHPIIWPCVQKEQNQTRNSRFRHPQNQCLGEVTQRRRRSSAHMFAGELNGTRCDLSLTDGGAGDGWASTAGGLGLHCGRPSFLCRVGIGGEGSLRTCGHTAADEKSSLNKVLSSGNCRRTELNAQLFHFYRLVRTAGLATPGSHL